MNKVILAACVSVLIIIGQNAKAQVNIDIESGMVFTGYNNVQIPGNTGSRFSLKDDFKPNPTAFIRIRGGYTFKSKHTFSILYAPLSVKSDGSINKQIVFQGETFPANTPINATYKFNSYRFTYRYDLVKNPKYEFGLGFTAKIRDAKIELSGGNLSANKSNVGFVPIINFRFSYIANDKYSFLLEGDALAAPQGRAEDVLIAANYKLSDKIAIKAGYRILEGGADNDSVYGFALFNYAAVGLTITL